MPKVTVKGKVKHFPYTKKGREEAVEMKSMKKRGMPMVKGKPKGR